MSGTLPNRLPPLLIQLVAFNVPGDEPIDVQKFFTSDHEYKDIINDILLSLS